MAHTRAGSTPIAVIGMSSSFSGEAADEDSFWNVLLQGKCTAGPVPPDRFNAKYFHHEDYNRLDTLPTQDGHFLCTDISAFDGPFFSIKPAEAAAMDPQSRLLLESSYLALENAGITLQKCAGTLTSVYIGCSADDYRMIYSKDTERPIRHAATGMAQSMLANKISWFYDLRGPSLTIDTACSSSLNAVHLACESLRNGQANMALAGGVNLFFTPDSMSPLAHLNFFSPNGRCFSFDSRANGYSRGEGFGVFVLKRLSEAVADHDCVRAIIRATGSNENGRTPGGITKVNADAQIQLMLNTYEQAGLNPAGTRYIEAHGPGTVGDLVECSSLNAVFGKFRTPESPLYIGSTKANIGHLEGAAGVSSLVKTVLALERGIMPKLANFECLHPQIAAQNYAFAFPVENLPWPSGLRRASVNSFGFGGSNAHVVVEAGSRGGLELADIKEDTDDASLSLLVFSAADPRALSELIKAYELWSTSKCTPCHSSNLDLLKNLAYTLSERRTHLLWRTFAVLDSFRALEQLSSTVSKSRRALNEPKLAFVFTGQGAQWAQMGIGLLSHTSFRATILECQDVLDKLGCRWNIIAELRHPALMSRINSAEYSQPLCTVVQIALVNLLREYKVYPQAVIGHSSGEIAAAYCTGGISLEVACRIAYFRGIISGKLEMEGDKGYGLMAAGLDAETASKYLKQLQPRYSIPEVCIACYNSSKSVTLSGRLEQLEYLENLLQEDAVFVRKLPVSVAYHSPYMAKVTPEYLDAIGSLESTSHDQSVRFFSSLTGTEVEVKFLCDPQYWCDNLTSPVRFSEAMQCLLDCAASEGIEAFVEVGPHPALRSIVAQVGDTHQIRAPLLHQSTLVRHKDSNHTVLQLLGSLHCLGYPVDLIGYARSGRPRLLQGLPSYPFNHSRSYWHESRLSSNYRFRTHSRSDLLGIRSPDWNPLNPRWRNFIRALENPWIQDHSIDRVLLYPGAGMLVMAIEAAAQHYQQSETATLKGFQMKDVLFLKSLNMSLDPQGTETEISLHPLNDPGDRQVTWSIFYIYTFENGDWNEVCRGKIMVHFEQETNGLNKLEEAHDQLSSSMANHHKAVQRCTRNVPIEHMYRRLRDYGLELGSTFKTFTRILGSTDKELVADVNTLQWTCKSKFEQASPHFVHPTTLDGVLQLGIAALSRGGQDNIPAMVPSRIRNLWVSASGLNGFPESTITGHAHSEFHGYRGAVMNITMLSNETHKTLIKMNGLETTQISIRETPKFQRNLYYELQWEQSHSYPSSASVQHDVSCETERHCDQVILIVADNTDEASFASHVRERLLQNGYSCSMETLRSLQAFPNWETRKYVFLLDVQHSFFASMDNESFDLLKTSLLKIQDAIWVCVTDNNRRAPIAGEIIGLSRTVRSERPDMSFTTMSIEDPPNLVEDISRLVLWRLNSSAEISYEPELLMKEDGKIYCSRLKECSQVNDLFTDKYEKQPDTLRRFGDFDNLKLGIGTSGSLDTLRFEYIEDTSNKLMEDEIEVRPICSGLNFLDCLTALGRTPHKVLGVECAGIVLRAGSKSDFKSGDHVMLCTNGTFQSHARCVYPNAVRIPDEMSFEVAAALPATGGTAYHALFNVARLQAGESILIHAGAGATGQMAIQMATAIGGVVFATVGSNEKKQYLQKAFGLPPSHILYSRDTKFADEIRQLTNGRGVDVVLNSLAGDSLVSSWECIAPFGRFIELGKRDVYSNKDLPMLQFAQNVSFHAVDLAGIWNQRPELMRSIAEGVLKLWQDKKIDCARPLNIFPVDQISDAFRLLQSGKHIGKIVLRMDPNSSVPVSLGQQFKGLLKRDRTYVVAGAFGGLGRSVTRWLVERGARHLLLLSRSGPQSTEAQKLVTELQSQEVQVTAPQCDVSDVSMLANCLEKCKEFMPTVDGCIQASMVLRDRFFKDMSYKEWHDSLLPKSRGSWNLHCLLPETLSFFVFLSSMSGVIGGRGQSNYAAGNTFQDVLARHRCQLGLRAISLDLGIIGDVGVLAEDPQLMHTLESEGFYQTMTQSDVHRLLDYYCRAECNMSVLDDASPQLVCGIAPAAQIKARGMAEPAWMKQPLFTELHATTASINDEDTTLIDNAAASSSSYYNLFASLPTPAAAVQAISSALVERLARSLSVPTGDISPKRALHFYGVDSLVAVELRNWFLQELRADVAIFEILGNLGCDDLASLSVARSEYARGLWRKESEEILDDHPAASDE